MDSDPERSGVHIPIDLSDARKSDLRTQFAALCFRMRDGKPEVLLVTTRGSGRWIVPKGWPMDGKTPMQSAAIEAWEEAGVRGRVHPDCLGLFHYHKSRAKKPDMPCVAMLYPLEVDETAEDYPEAGQRRRKWLRPKKAAARVAEPELAQMILDFDPARLRE